MQGLSGHSSLLTLPADLWRGLRRDLFCVRSIVRSKQMGSYPVLGNWVGSSLATSVAFKFFLWTMGLVYFYILAFQTWTAFMSFPRDGCSDNRKAISHFI